MEGLAARVQTLKSGAAAQEGRNVADDAFLREVDALLSSFYDDIGRIVQIDLQSLFDLFLLKSLYVARRTKSIVIVDYLSDLLTRFLKSREIFPLPNLAEVYTNLLPSLVEETQQTTQGRVQNLFEAYRKLADNSLFLTGLFPGGLTRKWSRRSFGPPVVNQSFFIRMGKDYYALAAEHELAEITGQTTMLARLASNFEVYMEALNDIAERYILGFDNELLADKMLDNFNRYRRTRDETYLENARKYAALLQVDHRSFRGLRQRKRQRLHIFE